MTAMWMTLRMTGATVRTFGGPSHPISVHVEATGPLLLAGDEARLRQCLENLIANAVQQSPKGAAVSIFVNRLQFAPHEDFDTYPRTKDGGFWHATSKTRESQLWGDGVFMSMPFLIRYGILFGDSKYAADEATKQMLLYAGHLNDPKTGLMFHAYDESGQFVSATLMDFLYPSSTEVPPLDPVASTRVLRLRRGKVAVGGERRAAQGGFHVHVTARSSQRWIAEAAHLFAHSRPT